MNTRVVLGTVLVYFALNGPFSRACPNWCNGHGRCTGGKRGLCDCEDQWNRNSECSHRTCPLGPAWWDRPQPNDDAHLPTECSNSGYCDEHTGLCECTEGFTGHNCARTTCPNRCSGHGRCMTMREAANRRDYKRLVYEARYEGWDADRLIGCVCDVGWTGQDCSKRECPYGDDPLTVGSPEIQSITTLADHRDEIQEIIISGDQDIDEVQEVRVYDTAGGTLLAGSFRLGFDTQTSTGFCNLCAINADAETTDISVGADATGLSGNSMQEKLQSMSPDVIDEVTVTRRELNETETGLEGYVYRITFVGDQVGGNVPQLTLGTIFLVGDSPVVNITTITDGNEVGGTANVTFQDRLSYPPGTAADNTATIARTMSDTKLTNTFVNRMDGISAISVRKDYIGGPGVRFVVTFTRNLGDISPLICNGDDLNVFTGPVNNITCNVTTIQDGNFLDGTFRVSYDGVSTPPLRWNTSRWEMAWQINQLNTTFGGVNVSRYEYHPNSKATYEWTGTYQWLVTFVGMKFDVPGDLSVNSSAPKLFGATGIEVVVGTAENPFSFSEQNPNAVETNEIQLFDCFCASPCSGGVRLALQKRDATSITPLIPYDASPSRVKEALESLPDIDRVDVEMFNTTGDGRIVGTMCDADGVTTSITFISYPGDVPPLFIPFERSDVEVYTLSSSSSSPARFDILHGDYQYGVGGGMSRDGSRVLLECSGRGSCNRDTGECECYESWGDSDRVAIHYNPGAGSYKDCSYTEGHLVAGGMGCPLGCSLRGTCTGGTFTCTCDEPYSGAACNEIACPTARAWFDEANGDASDISGAWGGHREVECGGVGDCNYFYGKCRCNEGFEGSRCQRSTCPSSCAAHGSCLLMLPATNSSIDPETGSLNEELTPQHGYLGWEGRVLQGCACNRAEYGGKYDQEFKDWYGPTCARAECPRGADPKDPGAGVFERQRITCDATSGEMILDFRGARTIRINATTPVFKDDSLIEKNSLEELLETSREFRDITSHPDPSTGNFSGTPIWYKIEREPDSTNFTIQTYNFSTNCVGRGPVAADFALKCEADLLTSAACWPFPTVCGTTDLGEAFSTIITFKSEHGDVPLIEVRDNSLEGGTVVIEEVVKGTKELKECSGRGSCDYNTGRCNCASGFGSGDGAFQEGDLGDCSHLHAYYGFTVPAAPPPPPPGILFGNKTATLFQN